MDLLARRTRPRAAAPVPYSSTLTNSAGFLSLGGRSTRTAELEAYGSVGTLFGVVSAISEAAAGQEWYMERVASMGNRRYGPFEPARRQVIVHPALDLLNNPNPFYSRFDLIETMVQHFKLVGEAFAVMVDDPRVPGLPVELWPVRPDRMQPIPSTEKFIAGWIYTGPQGERIPIGTDQLIHVKTANPLDPYRGIGPVQSLMMDLDSARYSAAWNRRFFLNDASPGGVIESDEDLNDDQFRKFRERWYDQHSGVSNAHRIALLPRGLRWIGNAFSPRDIQFAELRNVSRDAVREAFRVHKAILGQSDDVNRANAVAADYQLARWNVDPALARIQGALNRALLPRYGRPVSVELGFESAVQDDQAEDDAHLAAQVQAYATLVGAGVSPEDAASVVGLPPMQLTAIEPAPEPAPPAIEPTEEAA